MRRFALLLGIAALPLLVADCGGGTAKPASVAPAQPTSSTQTQTPRRPRPRRRPRPGRADDGGRARLAGLGASNAREHRRRSPAEHEPHPHRDALAEQLVRRVPSRAAPHRLGTARSGRCSPSSTRRARNSTAEPSAGRRRPGSATPVERSRPARRRSKPRGRRSSAAPPPLATAATCSARPRRRVRRSSSRRADEVSR